jgi:tetratricopeptide (TPR) repeat protein
LNSKTAGVVFVFFSSAFFLAMGIDAFYFSASGTVLDDMPSVIRMLGESRNIASNLAFLQADLYYHRGIARPDKDHGECLHAHAARGGVVHPEGYEGVQTNEREAVLKDPLLWISEELEIDEHSHLGTDDLKEIVPWLYYACKIDPGNVSAYTLASYYLSERFGKTEEALDLLKKGLKYNPGSWQVYAEIGFILYEKRRDYVAASGFLERSFVLMKNAPHDKFDERKVLTPLAYSYLGTGRKKEALSVFIRIKELFPDSQSLDGIISELQGRAIVSRVKPLGDSPR